MTAKETYPRVLALCAAGIALSMLSACRSLGQDITQDGQAGTVVFPSVERIVRKGGIFPNVDNVRTVSSGIDKHQLYHLLGAPHFSVGFSRVREWDYLFHLRTAGGTVTCQYKVIFDKHYRGQSFHWSPDSCVGLLAGAATAPSQEELREIRVELSVDALFPFAGFNERDLLPDARNGLVVLAKRISAQRNNSVRVVGHADRVGSDDDNQLLSERRAAAIRGFLVEHGVPAASIVALGRGRTDPVTTECADNLSHDALVDCLAPDRRVEIFFDELEAS